MKNNMLEKLDKLLESMPKEEFVRQWSELLENQASGPTLDEFINYANCLEDPVFDYEVSVKDESISFDFYPSQRDGEGRLRKAA